MGCDTSRGKNGDVYAPRQPNQNESLPQFNSNQPPPPSHLESRDPTQEPVLENDVKVIVDNHEQEGEIRLVGDLFEEKKNQGMNNELPSEYSTGPVTPHQMKITEQNPRSVSDYEKLLSSIDQSVKRQQQECDNESMKVNTYSSGFIYIHKAVASGSISKTCK